VIGTCKLAGTQHASVQHRSVCVFFFRAPGEEGGAGGGERRERNAGALTLHYGAGVPEGESPLSVAFGSMLISRGGLHYKNVDFRFTENETSEIGRYGREILSDIAAPLPLSLCLSLSLSSFLVSYRGSPEDIYTNGASREHTDRHADNNVLQIFISDGARGVVAGGPARDLWKRSVLIPRI